MIDERRYGQRQEIKRHSVMTKRECGFGVISFESLEWSEHHAKVVDVSITGLGIESDKPFNPGFVLFKDYVCGHKFGLVVWCRESCPIYRAGIEFVSLTRPEEEYIRHQLRRSSQGLQIQDPLHLLSTIISQHQSIFACQLALR